MLCGGVFGVAQSGACVSACICARRIVPTVSEWLVEESQLTGLFLVMHTALFENVVLSES